MFQISEVQEAPAFNGRRSFLTLRGDPVITSIAPGHDLRTSSLGDFKNQVAPSVAFVFT
jgi:hypothetical protein